jgi:RND family efflux transporter MFP subunit
MPSTNLPIHRLLVAVLALTLPTLALAAPSTGDVMTGVELTLRPTQVTAIGVRTQAVAEPAGDAGARYPGTVVVPPAQQRVVAAPLPALVESLRVSVGDSVRAGQVLAVLRSPQAQELQHDTHVSHTQAALARSTLARDEQLYKEGLIPLARLEASRVQADLTAEHSEEREKMLTQAGGAANAPSGMLTLTAPIAGVVLERLVVVGQRVDVAAPLLRIAKLSPLWVELQVPSRALGGVRVGGAVMLTGRPARGRILALAPTVDTATQSVMVRVEFSGVLDGLRAGQAVDARIDGAGAAGIGDAKVGGAVQLPAAAVLQGTGPAFVFVELAPGRYRATPVQRAGSSGDTAAVIGLPAGSRVVVHGTAALKALLPGVPR